MTDKGRSFSKVFGRPELKERCRNPWTAPHPHWSLFGGWYLLKTPVPPPPVAILPQSYFQYSFFHAVFLFSLPDSISPSFQFQVCFLILTRSKRVNKSSDGGSQAVSPTLGVLRPPTMENNYFTIFPLLSPPPPHPTYCCMFICFWLEWIKISFVWKISQHSLTFLEIQWRKIEDNENLTTVSISRVCGAFPLSCANSVQWDIEISAAGKHFSLCQKAVVLNGLRDHKITFLHSALGVIVMGKYITSSHHLRPLQPEKKRFQPSH